MYKDYLFDLNKAQKQAVEYIDGPSIVIAGAGSGKTRVLTYKVVHLLKNGYKPQEIMVLTFTNKAANEMRERLEKMINKDDARRLWMGTFHSIFAKILRFEAEYIGFSSNYTIYDRIDSQNIIKQIIKELNLNTEQYTPNLILSIISKAKNNLITADIYKNDFKQTYKQKNISEIFSLYQKRLRQADAMDFEDLLLFTNILFEKHKTILEKYQNSFRFILIDEYQDTNYAQYQIIKKLAKKHRHICVVGDDAQSIYAFRGARIENIFSFLEDFKEYKLFKLEKNYRSTQTIVNAANSVIAKNTKQIPKTIYTQAEIGNNIFVISHPTDYEEGRWVAEEIKKINKNNISYKDIAILYRMNFQSRIIEDYLRRYNVPYKIYGGISFYQRKEIKDIIAYMRLSINHLDEEALRRIINYPRRGIGELSQQKLFNYARNNDIDVWNVIENIEKLPIDIPYRVKTAIINFRNLIIDFREKAYKTDIYDFTHYIIKNSKILENLEKDTSQEGKSRIKNVMELLNVKEYSTKNKEKQYSISDFLQEIALITNEDIDNQDNIDKVNVMTIHSAKGLEFNTVFLVGTEMEIFPSRKADQNELEEERRLFYVALTRAQKQIYISSCERRNFWRELKQQTPSIFIDDIDSQYLQFYLHKDYIENKREILGSSYNKFKKEIKQSNKQGYNKPKKIVSQIDLNKMKKISAKSKLETIDYEPTTGTRIGMTVKHNKFGVGKVKKLIGKYPHTQAEIEFEKYGIKKILLKFAKLQLIK